MLEETESSAETSAQRYLRELWGTQLGSPDIGVHEDFFAAGGSSMQVIEMLMTVANEFEREIDYAEFLRDPCILKLSRMLVQ